MKKWMFFLVLVVLFLFFTLKQTPKDNKPIVDVYPWQIDVLKDGRSRVFGIVLNETTLMEVDAKLNILPEMALYESKKSLALEAYYKNVSLGGLIGSFIFTIDMPVKLLKEIKKESYKQERTENNEAKYKLDKLASQKAKAYQVKNLIYIPRVQLDEETIVKRFGKPTYKIKLKTKEMGWHYLYPEKGLDLIYKKEGKEVLQYIEPKKFNLLLKPLQQN